MPKDQDTVEMFDGREAITLDADNAYIADDGTLRAFARIARTGIQLYKGEELGRPEMDVVRVYRPEGEVFDNESLSTLTHIPITDDHPPEMVNPQNWRRFARGYTGDTVMRDKDFIRVPLMIAADELIKKVQNGKDKLSVGYRMALKWQAGVSPEGEAFDAMQTKIRGNHVAVVVKARGGDQLKIGDQTEESQDHDDPQTDEEQDMPEPKLTQLMLADGDRSETVMVESTDAVRISSFIDSLRRKLDAFAEKLKKQEEDAKKSKDEALADAAAKSKEEIDAKDAEIATLKKQLEDAQSPERLEAAVADRQEVMDKAQAILGSDKGLEKLSTDDIRRKAVDHVLGDEAKDWDDNQVRASFRALAITQGKNGKDGDPIRDHFSNGRGARDKASEAYDARNKRLSDAWRGNQAQS